MSSIKYRPEIDGLRAVAVIPVVLFHMGAEWLPGGFIGVDVFFVISGYLITSIILKDYEQGVFSFSRFWGRRIRRILPVLIVMVMFTSIVGFFVLYRPDISSLGEQGLSVLFSFANVNFWLNSGSYWGADAAGSPLLHTWSLSVEEQFYLFFPFLLILLLKFCKRMLFPALLLLCVLSVILFIYGSYFHPAATFYLLPTRAWELGGGCLLGATFYKYHYKVQGSTVWSSIGLLLIVLSYLLINGEGGISAYLIIPVAGAVLVISFSKGDDNKIRRGLSVGPIVYIGKISYSLYIWHWPVLILLKNGCPNISLMMLPVFAIPIISLLSMASYHFIEKPTRRNLKITPYIGLLLILAVFFSWHLKTSESYEDISSYNDVVWEGALYNVAPVQELSDSEDGRMKGIFVPKPDVLDQDAYANGGIIKLYGKKYPEVVVFGDSHALMWSGLLNQLSKDLEISISFYAADGTPTYIKIPAQKGKRSLFFTSEEKFIFDKMRLDYLKKWKPKLVVISARWSINNMHDMQGLIEYIGSIGSRVLLVEDPPELFFGDKNTPQYLSHMSLMPQDKTRKYIRNSNDMAYENGRVLIRELSRKYEYCSFMPIADIFLKDDAVWVLDGKDILYIDDDHLSRKGSLKAKNRFLKALQIVK